MSEPSLVLASASPRRRDLLARAGFVFRVLPAEVDEEPQAGEAAEALVARLSRAKAQAVRERIGPGGPACWILAADTVVVLGDAILGKPRDAAHAEELLASLLGRTHVVYTGVAVLRSDAPEIAQTTVASRVTLRTAAADEIRRYVASGEPLDKAGAYALQGEGRRFVAHVEGSETNVIGLPMDETRELLRAAGFESSR